MMKSISFLSADQLKERLHLDPVPGLIPFLPERISAHLVHSPAVSASPCSRRTLGEEVLIQALLFCPGNVC